MGGRIGGRAGLSLVEVLVAIGVIGLLAALAVPVAWSIRGGSEDSINLANLRSTHQQFAAWGLDHDDEFVNTGPPAPGHEFQLYDLGPGNGFMLANYGAHSHLWPLVLAPWTGRGFESWHSTHAQPREPAVDVSTYAGAQWIGITAFEYAATMLYDPRAYTESNCPPESWAPLRRRVAWSEVRFPAQKALLYDSARPDEPDGRRVRPVLFVDGSGGLHDLDRPGFEPLEGCHSSPVHYTRDGVKGVDFAR